MTDVHGIHPILYAFFDRQGRLDREAMRRQVEGCVAMGAHGVAALGLATEVSKLTPKERHDVMAWLAEDVGGRLPVAITVFGATPAEQIAYVKAAAELGAAWVILQPPQGESIDEPDLIRFFGAVMEASPIPVAIQKRAAISGLGPVRPEPAHALPQPCKFPAPEGRGLGPPDRGYDPGGRRCARCFQWPWRSRTDRQFSRRLCRHDTSARMRRHPGQDL